MKRVAILTQPLKGNYGGIIQNYALQQVLKKEGFEVETISREYVKDASKFRVFLANFKNETYNRLKGKRKKIFTKQEANLIFKENKRFIHDQLEVSKKLYSTDDLSAYFDVKKFDVVIVGSDQTWRPKYSPNIYNYFLDFLEGDNQILKIAYASSFGTDKWEFTKEEELRCKELVKYFNAVSVRELSGVSLCQNFLDTDAQWVLDPTLLLQKEDYMSLFQHISVEKKGVFNYVLDRESSKQRFIDGVANKLQLKLFKHQPHRSIEKGVIYDFTSIDDFKYPPLEGWLKSFSDSDFVLTDSFHGTVFSIIFNKPFLAIVNEDRGASRFYSLLKVFGLESRLVTDVQSFDNNILNEVIDYKKVNDVLSNLRTQSYKFIKESMIHA